MDESRLAELKRRIRAHPAFHGGPADETYWLDFMEWTLAEFGTYDFRIEWLADNLKHHPGPSTRVRRRIRNRTPSFGAPRRWACGSETLALWTVVALNGVYAAVVAHNYRLGSRLLAR